MKIQLDISAQEAEELVKILQKQIEKTEWVVDNKSPENSDFLQKRVDLMQRVIGQVSPSSITSEDDSLEVEEIE